MIVERFLDKLKTDLQSQGITSLKRWEFSRTYSKKNPQAFKWLLKSSDRKEQRVIASQFTVNELLKYDSFEIRPWDSYLLVFPKVLDQKVLPAQAQLSSLQSEIEKALTDFNQGLTKPKDALSQTLNLLLRTVSTMRGMPDEKISTNKPEGDKSGKVAKAG